VSGPDQISDRASPQIPLTDDAVVACDLFAGAGGFSLGAHFAGIHVAAAVELNKYAAATYRANLVDTGILPARMFEKDITDFSPAELISQSVLKDRACDILLGGPPCQGFSAHRIKGAGINDPRNALLLRYFEYVRALRPLFFLVENVPGLLWPRHASFVDAFYALAESADYAVLKPIILNAKDYGVPQSRRRVFLLGYDKKRVTAIPSWPPAPTHGEPDNAAGLPPWPTAAIAFGPALDGDPNDLHMRHGAELIDTFKRTPPNGGSRRDSGRVLPCHKNHVGHHDVYGRIDPSHPAPTMTTACINPSKGRFVHPTEHHGITLRQAARLQSFPDWFNFEGGIMAGGVQVGNAVPVGLAAEVIAPLRQAALDVRSAEKAAKLIGEAA
jgi:DNA (cytosine-5)-methyltransferase 1